MATLTIRQLNDEVYAQLKRDAKANHRSLEAEARVRLGQKDRKIDTIIERLRASQKRMRDDGLPMTDSVALIRAVRDEG